MLVEFHKRLQPNGPLRYGRIYFAEESPRDLSLGVSGLIVVDHKDSPYPNDARKLGGGCAPVLDQVEHPTCDSGAKELIRERQLRRIRDCDRYQGRWRLRTQALEHGDGDVNPSYVNPCLR